MSRGGDDTVGLSDIALIKVNVWFPLETRVSPHVHGWDPVLGRPGEWAWRNISAFVDDNSYFIASTFGGLPSGSGSSDARSALK